MATRKTIVLLVIGIVSCFLFTAPTVNAINQNSVPNVGIYQFGVGNFKVATISDGLLKPEVTRKGVDPMFGKELIGIKSDWVFQRYTKGVFRQADADAYLRAIGKGNEEKS